MELHELIRKDIINLHLHATSKKELFEEMADMLSKGGYVSNVDGYVQDLFKRESEYSTGIGFGLAIPHARSSNVVSPAIAVGKAANIKDYESLDEEPIQYIFMIAIPENTEADYMSILSKLARRFMDETFRNRIKKAVTAEEILIILEEK
ncbi:PTS sugar transporter subunit IIA [Erysipelothrix sp. HDW6C]|uniref:PTS sugar transporter subunit IIA n=1 Tax=Erysipelothrix sp. HDW6C TaxID=2714930 RepID=UPI001409B67C|nr:PTS sugar transporter subunit IIA [Erysipelothrix sp. HDW6C]QIK70074.1 PTS sugar transporter subunit IIA [Erysipelothrix sp. HDW6C]